MGKKRIALLYGGKSKEHDVSRRSAASVVSHIDTERFEPILIGITGKGKWYYQETDNGQDWIGKDDSLKIEVKNENTISVIPAEGLMLAGKKVKIDCVFPVLHGSFGEDGTVQGLLEIAGIPYVGSGVLGSSLSMDKEKAKRIWLEYRLPVVPFRSITAAEAAGSEYQKQFLDEAAQKFGYPVFVKPAAAGSSVGVTSAHSRKELTTALETALRYDTKAILEPAVKAAEIECSVVGNGFVQSFPPGEVRPTHDFYDYDAKYEDPEGAALFVPADIPAEAAKKIQTIAEKAYKAVDAAGFSRVDVFYNRETGDIFINEINTIPGFTSISMFPRLCEYGGLHYSDLISKLIELAWEQAGEKEKVEF